MNTLIAPTTSDRALSDRVARWLVAFIAASALVLVAALATGANTVFNVAVFVLFVGLWLAFATALVIQPGAPTSLWRELRRRSIAVQLTVWILFLPITAALWLWSRPWSVRLRAVLIVALAFVNLVMFFPRG